MRFLLGIACYFVTLPSFIERTRMGKKNFLFILFACVAIVTTAQHKEVELAVVPDSVVPGLAMYITPLMHDSGNNALEMKHKGGNLFFAEVPSSSTGFYKIFGVRNGAQYYTTLYLPGNENLSVPLTMRGTSMRVDSSSDNVALTAYQDIVNANSRRLWMSDATDDAAINRLILSYMTSADSLLSLSDCSVPVKEYLKLWSYISAYNAMQNAKRRADGTGHSLSLCSGDILSGAGNLFDSSMAALFFESYLIIEENIPQDTTLVGKLSYLYQNYKNEHLRKRVATSLVENFLTRHNYEADFDGGRAQLSEAVEKYGIDGKHLAAYDERRATIKGTPFPQSVKLYDANGNLVDFSTFKGKYVYIDMWASWCAPCRKEIPHLQKLEKELQNDDVVFLSISIDTDVDAWKQKMAEHNMHGYQLIDSNNTLGKALNVRGIPFFVIYDKDGRLYMHGAPRPSRGDALKEMLEKLH